MVKTKQQKSKTKKHPHVKKQGKEGGLSQFRAQLDAFGLKIIQVTADGNCIFRALADQLEGNEEEHGKYRTMVMQHIVKNRELFEPFIEDDIPFDDYCQSMEKDGTWAGHMELQAASLVTRCNICIHRNMSPRLYIRNFDHCGAHMVHLSYHDGEHYNSVRLKEDPGDGPAWPVIIKADADLSAKADVSKSRGGAGRQNINSGSIKLVMAGSGCESAEKVEQVLQQVDGDVDAALEFLIAEGVKEEISTENHSNHADISHGTSQPEHLGEKTGDSDQVKEEAMKEEESSSSNSVSRTLNNGSCQPDDKQKISRNKACPCGSKKKYKSCCGTAAGTFSTKLIITQAVDSHAQKGKKGRKCGTRGGLRSVSSAESDRGPPDVGALCI